MSDGIKRSVKPPPNKRQFSQISKQPQPQQLQSTIADSALEDNSGRESSSHYYSERPTNVSSRLQNHLLTQKILVSSSQASNVSDGNETSTATMSLALKRSKRSQMPSLHSQQSKRRASKTRNQSPNETDTSTFNATPFEEYRYTSSSISTDQKALNSHSIPASIWQTFPYRLASPASQNHQIHQHLNSSLNQNSILHQTRNISDGTTFNPLTLEQTESSIPHPSLQQAYYYNHDNDEDDQNQHEVGVADTTIPNRPPLDKFATMIQNWQEVTITTQDLQKNPSITKKQSLPLQVQPALLIEPLNISADASSCHPNPPQDIQRIPSNPPAMREPSIRNALPQQEEQLQQHGDGLSNSALHCKICLDPECTSDSGVMLHPCQCKGTLKNVHEECLKTWIVSQQPSDILEAKCEVCKYVYIQEITFKKQFYCANACQDGQAKCACASVVSVLIFGIIFAIIFLALQLISQSDENADSPITSTSSSTTSPTVSSSSSSSSSTDNSSSFGNQTQKIVLICICFVILVLLCILFYHTFKQACYVDSIKEWTIKQYHETHPSPQQPQQNELSRQPSKPPTEIIRPASVQDDFNLPPVHDAISQNRTAVLQQQKISNSNIAVVTFQQTVADYFSQQQRRSLPVMVGSHSIVFNAQKKRILKQQENRIALKRQQFTDTSLLIALRHQTMQHSITLMNMTTQGILEAQQQQQQIFENVPLHPSFFEMPANYRNSTTTNRGHTTPRM